ncbi:biotin biosynthesis protein BioC [Rhizobium sp. TRM95111]|uniref:biotin biosynthesis protein BioC n=1 Tax=Rhizobium alarense TaxID=2846851 RepID=UPI001F34BC44|nr:biotin biosynthesis protein BioC [Rhizobium alarense]MCF3642122.1 biotin biosynthesis protein BioC [Rhizobium alarense]
MYISNRIAGTATGDSLANLAARAAASAAEEPAEATSTANLAGGSYDPSAHVSLSVEALLILSAAKSDDGKLPALSEDERNNVETPELLERERLAFGHYREEGDLKSYYRAYIEYYDSLEPADQASERYAGTRDIAVTALRSLAYTEKATSEPDGEATLDTILASGGTAPAGTIAGYSVDQAVVRQFEAARFGGRISRANAMYLGGY